MLWVLVDVAAVILALGIVVMGFPGRAAKRFRTRLLESARGQSKASPRRDSSSNA